MTSQGRAYTNSHLHAVFKHHACFRTHTYMHTNTHSMHRFDSRYSEDIFAVFDILDKIEAIVDSQRNDPTAVLGTLPADRGQKWPVRGCMLA